MIVDDGTHAESDGWFWIGIIGDKYDTQMDVTSVNDYDFTLLNIESFWINFDSFYENNAIYSIYPNVTRNLGDVTKLIFVTFDDDRLYLDHVFIDGVSSVEITDYIEYQPDVDNGGCSFMIIDYILNDFYNIENNTFCPFDNFDNEDSVFFQNSTSPTVSPTTSPTSVPTVPTTHPTSSPTAPPSFTTTYLSTSISSQSSTKPAASVPTTTFSTSAPIYSSTYTVPIATGHETTLESTQSTWHLVPATTPPHVNRNDNGNSLPSPPETILIVSLSLGLVLLIIVCIAICMYSGFFKKYIARKRQNAVDRHAKRVNDRRATGRVTGATDQVYGGTFNGKPRPKAKSTENSNDHLTEEKEETYMVNFDSMRETNVYAFENNKNNLQNLNNNANTKKNINPQFQSLNFENNENRRYGEASRTTFTTTTNSSMLSLDGPRMDSVEELFKPDVGTTAGGIGVNDSASVDLIGNIMKKNNSIVNPKDEDMKLAMNVAIRQVDFADTPGRGKNEDGNGNGNGDGFRNDNDIGNGNNRGSFKGGEKSVEMTQTMSDNNSNAGDVDDNKNSNFGSILAALRKSKRKRKNAKNKDARCAAMCDMSPSGNAVIDPQTRNDLFGTDLNKDSREQDSNKNKNDNYNCNNNSIKENEESDSHEFFGVSKKRANDTPGSLQPVSNPASPSAGGDSNGILCTSKVSTKTKHKNTRIVSRNQFDAPRYRSSHRNQTQSRSEDSRDASELFGVVGDKTENDHDTITSSQRRAGLLDKGKFQRSTSQRKLKERKTKSGKTRGNPTQTTHAHK